MNASKKRVRLALSLATATVVGAGGAACGRGTGGADDTTTTTSEETTTSTTETTLAPTTTEPPATTTVHVKPRPATTTSTTVLTYGCGDWVPPTTLNPGDPMVVCGRPYRGRRKLMLPGVDEGDGLDFEDIPDDIAVLPAEIRRAEGERWLSDARSELASVPAFSELSLHLAAVGAPLELVTQSHRAALDEIRHANECLRLASLYLGRRFELGALPAIAGRRVAGRRWWSRERHLSFLAVQSLIDGCVSEGNSADDLRARARVAAPTAAKVAQRLASDEDRHTELAWQIVEWCKTEGGAPVERALERAMRQLSDGDLGVAASRLVVADRRLPALVPTA